MDPQTWSDVDAYICKHLAPEDEALTGAIQATRAAEMPEINITPNQGQFLNLLAHMAGSRRILEIGSLGGYSSIWLARALGSDGEFISLELEAKHAEVARGSLAAAGLACEFEVKVGPALEILPTLQGPFDLVFIDADKKSIPEYLAHAKRLSRPGSLIVIDNVVRQGQVLEADSEDPDVQGVRRMYQLLADDPDLASTALQVVGAKGHDGIAIARVKL